MEAKIIAALSSPLTWLFLTAFVGPELVRLLLSGEAFGVQFFTKLGNAPAADLTALIGDGAQGIVKAVAAGKTPADALQNAKAAVLTLWSQQSGRALKDVEAELGLLVEGKLTLHANLAPAVLVAPGGAAIALPKGMASLGLLGLLVGLLTLGGLLLRAAPAWAQTAPQAAAQSATFANGQFSHGPMAGGFLFRLQDPANGQPADFAFGAGLGYQFGWDFVQEDFGPILGKQPLLTLGFGGLALATSDQGNLLLSIGAGPAVCFIGSLACIVALPDIAQVYGTAVSGWIVGKFTPANFAMALTVGFQFGGSGQLATR